MTAAEVLMMEVAPHATVKATIPDHRHVTPSRRTRCSLFLKGLFTL